MEHTSSLYNTQNQEAVSVPTVVQQRPGIEMSDFLVGPHSENLDEVDARTLQRCSSQQ